MLNITTHLSIETSGLLYNMFVGRELLLWLCLRIMLNCTLFLPGIPVVGSMEKYGWPCRKLYRRRALLPLEGSSASLAVTWMTNVPEEKIHSYKKLSLWSSWKTDSSSVRYSFFSKEDDDMQLKTSPPCSEL